MPHHLPAIRTDRRPVAMALRVQRPEDREATDSLPVATVHRHNLRSNMARRQLLVVTGNRRRSPRLAAHRQAAAMANRKAVVMANRKAAVMANRQAAAMASRRAVVMANRKAAVTGNRKQATALQVDSVPRKTLRTACPVEHRWYRWAAANAAPSARSAIRS